MTSAQPFVPDWVSPPGDTIDDLLEERGWTQAQLAERTGFTRKHVNDLVRGRASITAETASRLSSVLGGPVQFWLSRETQYRAALERRSRIDALRADAEWLHELPVAWMVKLGWITRYSHRGAQVDECLRYFSVASVDAWRRTYANPLAAFRASSTTSRGPGAIASWLRQAELQANAQRTTSYSQAAFKALLPRLRALTVESEPDFFVPRLQSQCADAGVAVVFVPAPPGCPVHGATKWLDPSKALLALSLRYKTNDQLWFSFFHESCHILNHGKRLTIIEGFNGLDETLEEEANRFAGDLLIPPADLRRLATLRTTGEVTRMASDLEIAPGILVGRMQKEGWVEWRSYLNDLKVRYQWVDKGEVNDV